MLFSAEIDLLKPFTPNIEADRIVIVLWDRCSDLDDHLNEINAGLLRYC